MPVYFELFGRDYELVCEEHEYAAVERARDLYLERVYDMQKRGLSNEGSAVMAALGLAVEMQQERETEQQAVSTWAQQLTDAITRAAMQQMSSGAGGDGD